MFHLIWTEFSEQIILAVLERLRRLLDNPCYYFEGQAYKQEISFFFLFLLGFYNCAPALDGDSDKQIKVMTLVFVNYLLSPSVLARCDLLQPITIGGMIISHTPLRLWWLSAGKRAPLQVKIIYLFLSSIQHIKHCFWQWCCQNKTAAQQTKSLLTTI